MSHIGGADACDVVHRDDGNTHSLRGNTGFDTRPPCTLRSRASIHGDSEIAMLAGDPQADSSAAMVTHEPGPMRGGARAWSLPPAARATSNASQGISVVMASERSGESASATPELIGQLMLGGAGHLVLADGTRLALEPKDALLLAYLCLEGPTPRARLAALLWPDADDERARGNLRQRLLRLKRTTGVELVQGHAVAVLAAGVGHDLDGAHDLLHGIEPPQAGTMAEWLDARRERLRRARADELDAATTQAEACGDLAAALGHAAARVDLEPLSEHAHRRVMKLHYLRGDSAAAAAAYERCRETLQRELNAAPSKETEALRASIATAVVPTGGAQAAGSVPLSVLRPPRLVGRDAEWSALLSAWNDGHPAVVLGEAGLGKTRLVGDLARSQGGAVLVSARPGDERVVYAVTTRLLRQVPRDTLAALDGSLRRELARLLPEFGEADPIRSDGQRSRFFNAVAAALDSARTAVRGVVIDDLHFADDASLELLRYLAADSPLPWIFTTRTAEIGPRAHALLDALRAVAGCASIELAPLSLPQMVELVTSLGIQGIDAAQLAPALMRHSGGNPLFALETIKATLAQPADAGRTRLPVVANVGALIERRIGKLSPEAIRLVRCAAVAGQDFSAELAAHVLATNALDLADAWNELERAQVLRDGAFVHDLIHDAALASVPGSIARHLHGLVGRFLQARGAPPAHAASHLDAAGMDAEAAPLWVSAGDAAAAGLRYLEAANAYERAAQLFSRCGSKDKGFEAALKMRKVCFEIDLRDRSEVALQWLDQLAATSVERAWAANERAITCLLRGDLPGTETHARDGLRLLAGAEQPLLRAELRRSMAAVLTWRGEPALALNELRSIQCDIERLGTPADRFELVQSLAIVLDHNDQTDEAIERHRQGIELALALGNLSGAAQCALNLVVSQHDIGDLRAASQTLWRARSLLESLPDSERSYSSLELNSGLVERGLGRYERALAHFDHAIELSRAQTPGWLPLVVAHHAQTLLYLGQVARAQQALEAHAPDAQTPPLAAARWQAVRATLDHLLGRATAGKLDAVIEAQPARGRLLSRWRLQTTRLALPGDAHAQLAEAEALLPALARANRIGLAISVHARAAELATSIGDGGAAARHAQQALGLLRSRQPDSMYPGEVWLAAFRALRDSHPSAARQALTEGVEWVREIAQRSAPAEFRDSFVNRNPVNRELLTLATRLG